MTTKVVLAAGAAASLTGKLPHEILLGIARGEPIQVGKKTEQPTLQQMMAAAIAAGPYYAPRLISHEVSGKGGGSIQISGNVHVHVYKPESGRRIAPPAPANDAAGAQPERKQA